VSTTLYYILSIAITVICMIASYSIAKKKGRGVVLWTILAFFFSIITLIIIAVLPPKRA